MINIEILATILLTQAILSEIIKLQLFTIYSNNLLKVIVV